MLKTRSLGPEAGLETEAVLIRDILGKRCQENEHIIYFRRLMVSQLDKLIRFQIYRGAVSDWRHS